MGIIDVAIFIQNHSIEKSFFLSSLCKLTLRTLSLQSEKLWDFQSEREGRLFKPCTQGQGQRQAQFTWFTHTYTCAGLTWTGQASDHASLATMHDNQIHNPGITPPTSSLGPQH